MQLQLSTFIKRIKLCEICVSRQKDFGIVILQKLAVPKHGSFVVAANML